MGRQRLSSRDPSRGQRRALARGIVRAPFDVDIGPDSKGRPQLIFTRCGVERPDTGTGRNYNRGCDLVVFSLAASGRERPLRAANTSANEFAPTLWKGRIAFARDSFVGPGVELGRDERVAVYTRELSAPRSRPAERLPGIPRRDASGERSTSGGVAELELHGNRLAQIVNFGTERTQQTEVRLVDISDRSDRRLGHTNVGEGGQFFAGIGFADAHLAWALNCIVSCNPFVPGIYRYRLSTGELSRARYPRVLGGWIVGLALFDADGAYMVDGEPPADGCGDSLDPPVTRPCQMIRSGPLRFRVIRG